jgi:phage gpG-like protein
MAVSVKLDINVNDRAVKKMLKDFKNMDFRTPMRQSGVYMEGAIGRRFRAANWKGLSDATIRMHPRRAGGKPLNDTSTLKKSVTSQAVKTVSSHKLVYGTNLKYAPLHNFGGVGGFGNYIPKREFLYFDQRDEREIKKIFEEYIKGLSQRGG